VEFRSVSFFFIVLCQVGGTTVREGKEQLLPKHPIITK
jgi:hypothetical protein